MTDLVSVHRWCEFTLQARRMSQNTMNYAKFFTEIATRRRSSMIRRSTKAFMQNPTAINLAGGLPNSNTFPFTDITITFKGNDRKYLEADELRAALQYGASQGLLPLVEKWKTLQKSWHNPKRNDWDVLFTTGSQDGCSKIFDLFINDGEPVMIQAPTYSGIIGALAPMKPDVIEIQQDRDGIIPEEITAECEARLLDGRPMPKLLYINPTGANPTGTVLSEDRRRQVYECAKKYDFLIVEDDAYYFLHFLDKNPTSLFSLDTDGRVLRLDSFSKVLSAGIRVGVVTAHKQLIDRLVVHVENTILHTSSLSQMLVYKLLNNWSQEKYEEHLIDVQRFYREKRDMMSKFMDKYLTGLAEWHTPKGGMFFWIKLKDFDNLMDFVSNQCVPNGIFVLPGNAFNYDENKPSQYLRISYSLASEEEMDKGLKLLSKMIKAAKNKN